MHWLTDPVRYHYFDFSGRSTRKEYWMFQLLIALLYFAALLLGIVLKLDYTMSLVVVIFMVGFFIVPCISILVRRFHDVGCSGWWVLITIFPYIGAILSFGISCWPSQPGTNKYGANKYGIEAPVTPAVSQKSSPIEAP